MKLDVEKLAVARERFSGGHAGMEYLLQPIRSQLQERAGLSRPSLQSILVIDFKAGGFDFSGIGRVEHCSLFAPALADREPTAPIISLPGDGTLFDCVLSNLQGTWFEFESFAREIRQILNPGGVLCFSAFGPDTLTEVERAWNRVDSCPHVHPFVDMHHLGDMLLRAGFEKTIVDADWMRVEYPDCTTVIADLRSEGFINLHAERRKTLTGRHRFKQFESHLQDSVQNRQKPIITFEIIYGYAQKPLQADGQVLVSPPAVAN